MSDPILISRAELNGALSMFGGPRSALSGIASMLGAPHLPAPLSALCDALEGRGEVAVSIVGDGIDHRIVIR